MRTQQRSIQLFWDIESARVKANYEFTIANSVGLWSATLME